MITCLALASTSSLHRSFAYSLWQLVETTMDPCLTFYTVLRAKTWSYRHNNLQECLGKAVILTGPENNIRALAVNQ